MAVTLSSSLIAHQAASRRVPALSVVASATRGGVDILRWEQRYAGTEPAAPFAAVVTSAGTLLRVRNNGGDLLVAWTVSPGDADADFATWTSVGRASAGSPVAMASRGAEILLLSCTDDGEMIEARGSTDDGATWTSPSSVVGEATAIGAMAVAIAPSGDACLFYAESASNALKRLRRTSGSWAASGTAWTRSSLVEVLTGVSACHDGADYVLCVTGTDADGAPRASAVRMGDGGIPANAWSGLTALAEADAGATVTFAEPSILSSGGDFHAFVTRTESAHVAAATTITMHPLHLAGSDSAWTEPVPVRDASGGSLVFAGVDDAAAWAASAAEVYTAPTGVESDLSGALVALDWTMTAGSTHARFEFDDPAGLLTAESGVLLPGDTLSVHYGYATGAAGAPEYGVAVDFTVKDVARNSNAGARRVVVEADGPWEALARWHSPDSWQAAADDYTRDALFALLTARAGVAAASAPSPYGPPAEWTGAGMALALTPGESAATALRRLMLGLPVGAVQAGARLLIRGLDAGDDAAWALGGAGEHPVTRLERDASRPDGWVRLQGDGRYADAFDASSDAAAGVVNDRSAPTDTLAVEHATAVFREAEMARPLARLVLPFHAGLELWDVATVTDIGAGFDAAAMRVIEVGARYRRGPRGARYDTLITLGGV